MSVHLVQLRICPVKFLLCQGPHAQPWTWPWTWECDILSPCSDDIDPVGLGGEMEREHFCARCQEPWERGALGWARSPHEAAAAPASGSFDAESPRTVFHLVLTTWLVHRMWGVSYIILVLQPGQGSVVVLKDGRPEQVDCLWLPRGAYLRWTLRGMCSSNDRGWEQAAGEDAAPKDL